MMSRINKYPLEFIKPYIAFLLDIFLSSSKKMLPKTIIIKSDERYHISAIKVSIPCPL